MESPAAFGPPVLFLCLTANREFSMAEEECDFDLQKLPAAAEQVRKNSLAGPQRTSAAKAATDFAVLTARL
jgi:hypothetical protein